MAPPSNDFFFFFTETTVSLIAFTIGGISPNKIFLCFYSSMKSSLNGLAGVGQWLRVDP